MPTAKPKLPVPFTLYKEFNEILEDGINKRLGRVENKLSGYSLWSVFKMQPALVEELFRAGFTTNYFRKKLEAIAANLEIIPLDRGPFCDALEFLGCILPPNPNPKKPYTYERKLSILAPQYVAEHYDGNPDVLKYFLLNAEATGAQQPEGKLRSADLIELPAPSKKKSTHGTEDLSEFVFKIQYSQGIRTDRARLYFKLLDKTKIEGEYLVFYMDEAGRYPQQPEILRVTGFFSHTTIVTIAFENTDSRRKHYGVMLLKYGSAGDLKGDYIVYHDEIPEGRKGTPGSIPNTGVGYIEFSPSNNHEAEAFLNDVKGDGSAPERVNFSTVQ